MESKDWSGFGYFSPDFSPGISVSQRIWTPRGFKLNLSSQVFWCLEHTTNCFIFFQIRAKIPKATPILTFHESSKHLNDKVLIKMQNSSVHLNSFRF